MEVHGRAAEVDQVVGVVTSARKGSGGSLALIGEAGIGKSTLLEEAAAQAGGMRVLRARGIESESDLAFAGLSELLRPVLSRLSELPPFQTAELASALALGPPATGNRFAICVAVLNLVCQAAEEQPLLLLVDDMHWLDMASAQVLIFVARRLEADPVAALFAARSDQTHGSDLQGIEQIRLGGLSVEPGATVATEAAPTLIRPDVARELVQATGGNPLALRELARLLDADQLAGRRPLEHPLPVGPRMGATMLRPITGLAPEAGQALLVAAANDTTDSATTAAALARLGLDWSTLEQAESAQVVTLNGTTVQFRHPLLRSAIYHEATPADRRAAHRVLAEVLGTAGRQERQAWHLAAAVVRPDESVAQLLSHAGTAARQRGAPATAARTMKRAASLTPVTVTRAGRLLQAAYDSFAAGWCGWSAELATEALRDAEDAADSSLCADVQCLRGSLEVSGGSNTAALRLMTEAADRVAPVDAERAARLQVVAAMAAISAGTLDAAVILAGQACREGARSDRDTSRSAEAVLGLALCMSGEAERGLDHIRTVLRDRTPHRIPDLAVAPVVMASLAVAWFDPPVADRVLTALAEDARAGSLLGRLGFTLATRSEVYWPLGRWKEAYADAAEAVTATRDAGQNSTRAYALVCLARVEAGLGRTADCEAHLEECDSLGERMDSDMLRMHVGHVRGLLALGQGRFDEARAALDPMLDLMDRIGLHEPAAVPWLADLVEVRLRTGDRDGALAALALLAKQADATGRRWAVGAVARCRGLLGDDPELSFAAALDRFGTTLPFDQARTQLALGEHLRRSRRRAAATACLEPALATFEWLGADSWAERTRTELRAGQRRAAPDTAPAVPEHLTSQEMQVALLVSTGSTNRETARALFLSEKTIEAHLSRIYRKLTVRSRTELAAHVAGWRQSH